MEEFLGKYLNEKDRSAVLKSLLFTFTTMVKEPKRNRIDLGNSMNKVLEAKIPGNIGMLLDAMGFLKKSDTLYEFENSKENEGAKGNKAVLEEVSRLFEEMKASA